MLADVTSPSLAELRKLLLSQRPEDFQQAVDALDQMLAKSPEIGAGVELPKTKGVVRYDSAQHTDEDLAALPRATQRRVLAALAKHPGHRVVITQTAPWPADDHEHKIGLIAAQRGFQLVLN